MVEQAFAKVRHLVAAVRKAFAQINPFRKSGALKVETKNVSENDQTNTSRVLAKYHQGMSIDAIALSEGTSAEEISTIVKQNERVLT